MGPGLERLRSSPKAESIRALNREGQAAAQKAAETAALSMLRVRGVRSKVTTANQYRCELLDWLRTLHGVTLQEHRAARGVARQRLYGELLAYDGLIHVLERTSFGRAAPQRAEVDEDRLGRGVEPETEY